MPAKPHLNLVFIGHVDHGKSTTVGRILYDTGNIDPHELENLKKLAEQMGKATFEFAFVMDQVKEEDRKSTRLNSSHSQISYAVFCLKKKKKMKIRVTRHFTCSFYLSVIIISPATTTVRTHYTPDTLASHHSLLTSIVLNSTYSNTRS